MTNNNEDNTSGAEIVFQFRPTKEARGRIIPLFVNKRSSVDSLLFAAAGAQKQSEVFGIFIDWMAKVDNRTVNLPNRTEGETTRAIKKCKHKQL